jgi:hypothetical protein
MPRIVNRRLRRPGAAAALLAVAIALTGVTGLSAASAAPGKTVRPPAVRHVFVVNLENKGYDETFGPASPAPYLSRELRAQGQLLTQYYGTAHNSLPNYIAQVSGQGPNPQTQADCQVYSDFVGTGTVTPQQAVGDGCVYPRSVLTVADQLTAKGLTWRGYMEDSRRHPRLADGSGVMRDVNSRCLRPAETPAGDRPVRVHALAVAGSAPSARSTGCLSARTFSIQATLR